MLGKEFNMKFLRRKRILEGKRIGRRFGEKKGVEGDDLDGRSVVSALTAPDEETVNETRHSLRRTSSLPLESGDAVIEFETEDSLLCTDISCHDSSPVPHRTLPHSLALWLESVGALLHSQEMEKFVLCSRDVVVSVGDVAIQTAILPFTVPLHVIGGAKDLVVGVSVQIISCTVATVEQMVKPPPCESTGESNSSPVDTAIKIVHGLPGFIFGVIGKVSGDLGSTVAHVLAPVLGDNDDQLDSSHSEKLATSSGESSAETNNFLDRLRLDYTNQSGPESATSSTPKTSNSCRLYLRVNDIEIADEKTNGSISKRINFLDMSEDQLDRELLGSCIEQLLRRALSFIANHPTVRTSQPISSSSGEVAWKTEAATSRLLSKMVNMSTIQRLKTLEKDVLIWSGALKDDKMYGSHFPFFLARGVIPRSPRSLLELLWDNSRTSEYNNFCLGRSTITEIDDEVLTGAEQGTKLIKSETRVPFTGLSVMVSCMMHVQPMVSPDEGYLILSRSLDSPSDREKGRKNEILWGLNILRRVPGHPNLTDLTSMSQVGSSMVPKFLANKIGVMGIEDFFKNVRNLKEAT